MPTALCIASCAAGQGWLSDPKGLRRTSLRCSPLRSGFCFPSSADITEPVDGLVARGLAKTALMPYRCVFEIRALRLGEPADRGSNE
jgi:hypothetical protein